MKTIFKLLLLLAVVVAGSGRVRGEIRTITITADSIKHGGGTLNSGNYNNGAERTWTQDDVSFGGKAITEGTGVNADAIQMEAANGVLYNTTPLPGKIVSIELHSVSTPRPSSCYGGKTSRLVNSDTGSYSVTDGTRVGLASDTGWTAEDFSGTEYVFFAIKRGSSAAYLSSVVITCDVPLPPPSVSMSPSALAFGTVRVDTFRTLRLNIKGAYLTQDITLSISADTASVFSLPVAAVTAAEAMRASGRSVDVVFTPARPCSYGGTLRISSADFADTTVALTGAGGTPALSADSLQVRFGSVAQGNSASRSIRITPTLLTDSISVSFVDNASGFFGVAASKLPYSRNPTVPIAYAPTEVGEHTATLRLQSGLLIKDIPLSARAASLLLEENFEYELGQKLTDNGWAAHSAQGTSPILVAPGLAFNGYAASGAGGAAAVVNTGEDVNRQLGSAPVTSGKVYVAFMFQTEPTNNQGYFMHLAQVGSSGATSTTAHCSRLYVSGNGERVGVSESGTISDTDSVWLAVTPGVTHLGVVELDLAEKRSRLYVFSAFPAEQPGSGYATSAAAASVSNVGAVALRQYDPRQRITVDGIRVATTWAEAVQEMPIPPAFTERPAVDSALLTATAATVRMRMQVNTTAQLYYTVKTAPVASITAADVAAAAKDSATVAAGEEAAVELRELAPRTKYYAYFAAQNAFGLSEVDSAVFATPATMALNSGVEHWTGSSPNAWTITGSSSYAKDTVTVKGGRCAVKITATSGRVDMKQTIYGVVAGRRYDISFWCYIETLGSGSGIRLWANFSDETSAAITADNILRPTSYQRTVGQWTQFVVKDYIAPDSAVSFNFEVRIMNGVTAYFDDFYFAEEDLTAPTIRAVPAEVLFGALAGDTASQAIAVTAANITENLTVSISGANAAYFSAPATLSTDVDTLRITYTPGAAGSHSATLTIAGGGAEREVPLSGTAWTIPSVSVSPSTLAFGTVRVDTFRTLRLNIKGAYLTQDITLSISADTASVFSLPVAAVAAAEAMRASGRSVDVVFTPARTCSYGGTLRISSADFADTTVALTGAGGTPALSVDSLQVRFGSVAQGNSASRTIRVTPTLLTDSISVSFVDNASGFFGVAASKLPYSRNTTVPIAYAPTEVGEHTATLRLQSGLLIKDIPLSARAVSLLLEENFEYELGQKLTDNGWAAHSSPETSPILVAPGLTFNGYAASGAGGAAAVVNIGEDVNRQLGSAPVTSGKVYVAFMFQTEPANRQGYFMHLAQVSSTGATSSTALCSRLYVSGSGERVGVSESGTISDTGKVWLAVTPGVTHLGVVAFDLAEKRSRLYAFSAFPAEQPSSGYVTSSAAASVSNVGAVALRQYDARQSITVDGIRVATTWAEAVKEMPIPPSFTERPAVDSALLTATAATVRMRMQVNTTAQLYYTVKTAPVPGITAADVAAAAKDSATVAAGEEAAVELRELAPRTKYYAYFAAQNAFGLSEVDSAVFTTTTTMVMNLGFERWTDGSPNAWTITGSSSSYAKDTVTVKGGRCAVKITAISGRVDMKQTIYGVVAGRRYDISFWCYIEALGSGSGIRLWANFSDETGAAAAADNILHPTSYQRTVGQWTQFVVKDYIAPDSAVSFNFEVRIMNGVTAYFDDFHFAEASKAAPIINVAPDSLSFSAAGGGNASQTLLVATINISEDLTVGIGGSDSCYFSAPATLASGVNKMLTVTYAPDSAGNHSATLVIAGGGIFREMSLTGTATDAPPSITITPIDSICTGADTSPFYGQRVTIAGIVTAVTRSKNFFVQSGSGARSGIYVYRRGNLVQEGDSVLVAGWVNESHQLTEIMVNNDADITVAAGRRTLPLPTPVTIDQLSKAYHGVLLSIASVEVAAHATDTAVYMVGSDGTTVAVARDIAVTQPAAGSVVDITGIGFCHDVHLLLPRSASDVKIVKDASPATAAPKPSEYSMAIYPNPVGNLLRIQSVYGVAKVEVYTLTGVAALRKEAVSVVSTASLQPGVYIVRVTFVNGTSLAKVIIKK